MGIELENGGMAYNVKEAAQILERAPYMVRLYIRNGDLRAHKVGRSYYISSQAIEDFKKSKEE